MKKIFFIQFFLTSLFLNAQNTFPLKEAFDDYLEKHYTTGSYDYTYSPNRPNTWISWGHTLSAYLNMYKATGDKAYLNKFVKHAYDIALFKGQNALWSQFWDMSSSSYYSSDKDKEIGSFHYTGRMIHPYAEFVYMIKQEYPNLQNTPILTDLIPNNPFANYNDFANYIKSDVVEPTLDFALTNYYINSSVGFSKTYWFGYTPCEINQQADWACALLYAGKVNTNNQNYTTKGIEITNIFKNARTLYTPNNSYTWWHNDDYREDVAHGATDLSIVIVGYKLYGNGLWTTQELNYFAHTFTYNIWDRTHGWFTNNVFGMQTGNTDQIQCVLHINFTVDNFWGPGEILSWMPIYEWDDANAGVNGVYYLLLNQGINLISDNNPLLPSAGSCGTTCDLSGAQAFQGFSELVRAQWREECVNLTLRNRNLEYNQDFNVKNNLIIDPTSQGQYCSTISQNYPNSFAYPVFSQSKFIINTGVTSNMIAGESITFRPGFEVQAGANFSASINTNACTNGMKVGNNNATENISENFINGISKNDTSFSTTSISDKNIISDDLISNSFNIYPNPTTNFAYIAFTIDNSSIVTIKITDILGQDVFSVIVNKQLSIGNYIIPFDGNSLTKGIYLCTLIVNEKPIRTEKIILTK